MSGGAPLGPHHRADFRIRPESVRRLRAALRVAAVASVILILILSWVPGEIRPHVMATSHLEHFVAYAASTALQLVAFPGVRRDWLFVAGMAALAGVAEIGQLFVPGRVGEVAGAVVSTCGAAAGWIGARIMAPALRRTRFGVWLPAPPDPQANGTATWAARSQSAGRSE